MPSYISWRELLEPHLVISKIYATGHKEDGWIVGVISPVVNPMPGKTPRGVWNFSGYWELVELHSCWSVILINFINPDYKIGTHFYFVFNLSSKANEIKRYKSTHSMGLKVFLAMGYYYYQHFFLIYCIIGKEKKYTHFYNFGPLTAYFLWMKPLRLWKEFRFWKQTVILASITLTLDNFFVKSVHE